MWRTPVFTAPPVMPQTPPPRCSPASARGDPSSRRCSPPLTDSRPAGTAGRAARSSVPPWCSSTAPPGPPIPIAHRGHGPLLIAAIALALLARLPSHQWDGGWSPASPRPSRLRRRPGAAPWLWGIGVVIAIAVPIAAQLIVRPGRSRGRLALVRPGRGRHRCRLIWRPAAIGAVAGTPPDPAHRLRPGAVGRAGRRAGSGPRCAWRQGAARRSPRRASCCSWSPCCRTPPPLSAAGSAAHASRRHRLRHLRDPGGAGTRDPARGGAPRAVRPHRAAPHADHRGARARRGCTRSRQRHPS